MAEVIELTYKDCDHHQLAYNPGADDPRPLLERNKTYTLKQEYVYDWHTLVELNEVPGKFPSVVFQDPRFPDQVFISDNPTPLEKTTMALTFNYTPFTTDLPDYVSREPSLVMETQSPHAMSWQSGGRMAINMIHTHTTSHQQKLPPLVDLASMTKFNERHFHGETQDIVKRICDKLIGDGWCCITMHERPDEHVKFEWLRDGQHLLTINLMTH